MSYTPDMTVEVLDIGCRAFIWEYTDPIFTRLYAWFPDESSAGWWYSKNGDGWFESCAGSDDVDSSTISHGQETRGAHRFRCLTTMTAVEQASEEPE